MYETKFETNLVVYETMFFFCVFSFEPGRETNFCVFWRWFFIAGIFPFAFAIVESENNSSWLWFLEHLSQVVSRERKIAFISDRAAGLIEGIPAVFGDRAHHFYCLEHLKRNLRDSFGSRGIAKSLRETFVFRLSECAYAVSVPLLNEKLASWRAEGSHALIHFIESVPLDHWTTAHSPPIRYGEMFSNVAESFNAWIDAGRGLPIKHLIEFVREKVMTLFERRRTQAANWNGTLCPERDKLWRKLASESQHWMTGVSSGSIISVHSDPSVTVELVARTCSCGWWQVNGFPCAHAVAALRRSKMRVSDIVDRVFHVESYRESYAFPIFPVPSMLKHQIALEIQPQGINPPNTRRPSGRPKKKRIRSRVEVTDRKSVV